MSIHLRRTHAKKTLIFTVLVLAASVNAAEPEPFSRLNTVEVKSVFPEFKIRVHYDPAVSTVRNQPHVGKDSGIPIVDVLDTRIDRTSRDRFTITYTDGLSADPGFLISPVGTDMIVGDIWGLELFVPGNGAVYVTGHTNNHYNQRKTFVLKNGKLVEIRQPFYYVGLDSKAKQDITIFSDKSEKEPVASIPSGAQLTVLLNEGEHYLIKTPMGLVGWARFVDHGQGAELIEGLYYRGD